MLALCFRNRDNFTSLNNNHCLDILQRLKKEKTKWEAKNSFAIAGLKDVLNYICVYIICTHVHMSSEDVG